MQDLIDNVIEWGAARGLHETTDLRPQLTKLIEELGEIAAGVARQDNERIIDGVGDLLVVLINFGVVHNKQLPGNIYTEEEPQHYLDRCLEVAWNQIKNRAGRTENGIFVKDES